MSRFPILVLALSVLLGLGQILAACNPSPEPAPACSAPPCPAIPPPSNVAQTCQPGVGSGQAGDDCASADGGANDFACCSCLCPAWDPLDGGPVRHICGGSCL